MSNNYDLIAEAIKNKKQVIAMYKGKLREMCPHVLGRKNGKEQALFYQFGGESSSSIIIPGSESNWRCIQLDGLTNVSLRDGDWHTADNHSRNQTCVDDIDFEVSF